MDYDLTRLGSREFEHLTQALTVKVIGNGVSIFGDGRDGGREAVFHGRIRFPDPSPDGPWDGYGVLQSKFRARPLGTKSDTPWLCSQIRRELSKWGDPKSARTQSGDLPEYLIIATNVVLSSVAEVGGIVRVEEYIRELVKEYGLPLRDWRVWHYDQIRTFLDLYPEIRQPYEALVTAGDVLAQMRHTLQLLQPSTDKQSIEIPRDASVNTEVTLGETSGVFNGVFSAEAARFLELHHEIHDTRGDLIFLKAVLRRALAAQGYNLSGDLRGRSSVIVENQRWKLVSTREVPQGNASVSKLAEARWLRDMRTPEECAEGVRLHLPKELDEFDRIILLASTEHAHGFSYRLMEIPKSLLENSIKNADASIFRRRSDSFVGRFPHPNEPTHLFKMACIMSAEKISITIPERYCIQHASWLVRPRRSTR
ncbi:hypothetical protein [Streptomyces niveus]|uniref:Restriction endonuclease n=1 Tax=Streptomyces niveus TaxID=193462 RepID=A0ABZ1ZXY0_STRNV|nr:hypothetical protein [Streptomyces niveus]